MKLPGSRIILITLGGLIALIVIVLIIAVIFQTRRNQPTGQPLEEVATKPPEPAQPVEYPVEKPMIADDKLYFINIGSLEYYDLRAKSVNRSDFPPSDSEFIIVDVLPLSGVSDKSVILLEKFEDSSHQFAIYDFAENRVTTKFVERMLAVAWLPDQQKLVAYAKSKTGEPFFLLTSLDAKDQKVLAKTTEENVQPLALIENRLLYLVSSSEGKSIKQLDLGAKEVKVVVSQVNKALAAPDGKSIAYETSEGLFLIDAATLNKTNIPNVTPSFFNWSGNNFLYGASTGETVTISRWDSVAKKSSELLSIKFTEAIPSVEAAFEDTVNNQLIYWSDGFLFAQKIL